MQINEIELKVMEILISMNIIPDEKANTKDDEIFTSEIIIGNLESVQILELIIQLEKEFNVEIAEENITLNSFRNIKSIAEFMFEELNRTVDMTLNRGAI
jgi:acyl carrier protein